MRLFRWLLIGLHHDSGNIVDVFQQWQSWRAEGPPGFPDNDRAFYYARGSFAGDFIEFVQLCYIPTSSKSPISISALAKYESALLAVRSQTTVENGHSSGTREAAVMSGQSRPQLNPAVRVVQLGADYQEIIRRLRRREELNEQQSKPVIVVITPIAVLQLSPVSAELLRLCEGSNTIKEIAAEFSRKGIEVAGVPADTACLAGIEMLRQQQILTLT
jgi:hypothetical protein